MRNGKFADVICFVLGPVFLVAGLLNFSGEKLRESDVVIYGYGQGAIFLALLGVALLALGLLRARWRKKGE